MNTDEIIDKIKFAIELCGDGGPSPFSTEEINEMYDFLNAKRMPQHGYHQWHRGKEPRWKVGDYLAYHEYNSYYEGEEFYGKIIDIQPDDEYGDWLYTFKNKRDGEYCSSEEQVVNDKCYKVSKEYYEKHC